MAVDLSTRYLGLRLTSPLVVSACPLTESLSALRTLEEAGAGAAVLPSLFEEQIEHEQHEVHRLYEYGAELFPEALHYFPELDGNSQGPADYLKRIEDAKKAVRIPIIASLNGHSEGGWLHYAQLMEQAGADALELNVFWVPTDPDLTALEVENRYLDLVEAVRGAVSIPLAVKIPFAFTSIPHLAHRIESVGADGLVLFNRLIPPDVDLDTLELKPNLTLSTHREIGLPLWWIGILSGTVSLSLAATSGVHAPEDVAKLLLVGADVAMTASALLRHGPEHLRTLRSGLEEWMEEKEYESVNQMRGSLSRRHCPTPEAYERANYMRTLVSYTGREA